MEEWGGKGAREFNFQYKDKYRKAKYTNVKMLFYCTTYSTTGVGKGPDLCGC